MMSTLVFAKVVKKIRSYYERKVTGRCHLSGTFRRRPDRRYCDGEQCGCVKESQR